MHELESEMKPCPPGQSGILDMVNAQLGLPTSKDEEIERLRETISGLHTECQDKDNEIEELRTDLEKKEDALKNLSSRFHQNCNKFSELKGELSRVEYAKRDIKARLEILQDERARLAKIVKAQKLQVSQLKTHQPEEPVKAGPISISRLKSAGVPESLLFKSLYALNLVDEATRKAWIATTKPIKPDQSKYEASLVEWAVALTEDSPLQLDKMTHSVIVDVCSAIAPILREIGDLWKHPDLPGFSWSFEKSCVSVILRTSNFWGKHGEQITPYLTSIDLDDLLDGHWIIDHPTWAILAHTLKDVEKLLSGIDSVFQERDLVSHASNSGWIKKKDGIARLSGFYFPWPNFNPQQYAKLKVTKI